MSPNQIAEERRRHNIAYALFIAAIIGADALPQILHFHGTGFRNELVLVAAISSCGVTGIAGGWWIQQYYGPLMPLGLVIIGLAVMAFAWNSQTAFVLWLGQIILMQGIAAFIFWWLCLHRTE